MMHDDEPMGPDLRFASPALEQRFREARLRATRRLQCWAEAMRAACWVVVALKAAAGGRNTAAAGFALGTLTSAALLALYASPGQRPLSRLYGAILAVNLAQCALAAAWHDVIYPPPSPQLGRLLDPTGGGGGGGLGALEHARAIMLAVVSAGPTWFVFYGKLSPLPFRWQAAQLCGAAALLAGGTRAVCANSNVLVGYAHLDRALLLLSFIQIPQAINHVPREAWARLAPRPAAQQLCRTYQPTGLLLALAAVLRSLYRTERQQRLRLLGEQRRAAQAAASDS